MFFTMSSFSLALKVQVQYQLVHPISPPPPFSWPTRQHGPKTPKYQYLNLPTHVISPHPPQSHRPLSRQHYFIPPFWQTDNERSGGGLFFGGDEIGLGGEQCIDRFARTTIEAEPTGRKLGMMGERGCTMADKFRAG